MIEMCFQVWAVLSAVGTIVFFLRVIWVGRSLRPLQEEDLTDLGRWPSLSVVVTARNEAEQIESALRTLMGSTYPHLELVVVNDRSEDRTGEIVDRLAEEGPVQAVHLTDLPEGWLGKVHAQARGAEVAKGDWLLFTDADVGFSSNALKRAVAFAERSQLDHLALFPDIRVGGFWAGLVLPVFGSIFLERLRLHRLEKPGSGAYVGVGAFNLVRRDSLLRSEGLAWIRMEVADDVGLGLVLQRSGARSGLRVAREDVKVLWYPDLITMFEGLEKNLFGASCHYRFSRYLVTMFLGASLLGGLVALPFLGPAWISMGLPFLIGSALIASSVLVHQRMGTGFYYGLLFPVGFVLLASMLSRSAWACWRNQGISWRGTRYPIGELRANQRVKI
jgi:glycosyltransferase involved in cell wall biosynthesis